MNDKNRKYTLLWFLFLLVNIAIIAFIAWREFHSGSHDASFRLGVHGEFFLLAGVGCLVIIFITETVKIFLTMRFLKERISVRDAFETVALGRYYDALMPTGGGGQPFQIYWLSRLGYSARASAATPASYFITRQAASMLITVLTFLIFRHVVGDTVRYAAYLGLFFCAIPPTLETAFSLNPKAVTAVVQWILHLGEKIHLVKDFDALQQKIIRALSQYHSGFLLLAGNMRMLLTLMFYSILNRMALCCLPYFVLKAFGCQLGFAETFATTVYIYSAVTLIPTPGNSGVSEGAFYYVFSSVGSGEVFWAMLIWRGLCYYSFLLTGLLVFARQTLASGRKRKSD